jgi:uncharacterized membrane protein
MNINDNPKPNSKQPLFIRRKDGSGWDLNIGSPLSYVVLAVILIIPFVVIILCVIATKK